MIKKIIVFFIVVGLFSWGCKNNQKPKVPKENQVAGVKLVDVDLSINKSNAYNDLFLDSGEVGQFIRTEKLDDTIAMAIRSFYNTRNFEFAWFASTGLIEQSLSFRSLYSSENDADLFNKSLENRLDRLRIEEDSTIEAKDPSTIKTELQITQRFVQYALKNYASMGISINALGNYIPSRRKNILDLADSVLANNAVNNNYAALNESYKALKVPLLKYSAIAKRGGWLPIITESKKLKVGSQYPTIVSIKKRLEMTGELASNDTSQIFNTELEAAIKAYQRAMGIRLAGQ